jgi:hypothetical protein
MKSPITGCILLILGLGLYTVPKDAPRWARTVGLFGSGALFMLFCMWIRL